MKHLPDFIIFTLKNERSKSAAHNLNGLPLFNNLNRTNQVFLSPLYLISLKFSSLLARATAPIPFLKQKISDYIIFTFLSKKYKINSLKVLLLKCFKYLNKF